MLRETSPRTQYYLGVLTICLATASVLASRPSLWGGFVAAELAAGAIVFILWRRDDVGLPTVLAFAILFRLLFLWLPPVLSDDAYRYVWDGLVQTEGINPFAYRPADPEVASLRSEHIYSLLNSSDYYTVYPPVSQFIFRIGASFYDSGWLSSYYIIKALLGACEAAALWILSRHLKSRHLMLYAWNPLVILAATGQAHTEAAAVLFLVLAWTFAGRGRGGWSSVAVAAAGLVKLYPLVLLPLLWRRFGWRGIWPGLLTILVFSLPYYHGAAVANVLSSLDLYVRYFEFNAGIYYGIKKLFAVVTGDDWSKQIGPALRWLFLAGLPCIYYLDARHEWSLRRAMVIIIGLFFVCSTTIHPWYLLPLLVLVAPARPPSWHWYWLGLASVGTYLLYIEGAYWPWVVLGWLGWTALGASRYFEPFIDFVLHRRAGKKVDLIWDFLVDGSLHNTVVDLGAGEGYVGQVIAQRTGADVTLADIIDLNRTELPHVVYDGHRLPFDRGQFDLAVLIYVLHHAESASKVLLEAARVSGGKVIVLESVYTNPVQRAVLTVLDHVVNYIRSSGRMSAGQHPLDFRTFGEWTDTFRAAGFNLDVARDLGGVIHRRALFVLSRTSDRAR